MGSSLFRFIFAIFEKQKLFCIKRTGISKEFDEWFAIAKGRSKWRQLTHSNPKPPDA